MLEGELDPEEESKEQKKSEEDEDEYKPGQSFVLKFSQCFTEYSWDNTDDMSIYDFALYEAYLQDTRSVFDKFQGIF